MASAESLKKVAKGKTLVWGSSICLSDDFTMPKNGIALIEPFFPYSWQDREWMEKDAERQRREAFG